MKMAFESVRTETGVEVMQVRTPEAIYTITADEARLLLNFLKDWLG